MRHKVRRKAIVETHNLLKRFRFGAWDRVLREV